MTYKAFTGKDRPKGEKTPDVPLTDKQRAWAAERITDAERLCFAGRLRFWAKRLPADDARGAAYRALCRVAAKYDPTLGFAWSTLFVWTCRGELQVEYARHVGTSRTRADAGDLPKTIQASAFESDSERDSGIGFLSPVSDDMGASDAAHDLAVLLAPLDTRSRRVLLLRQEYTLNEVADQIGVTKERVRQIEAEAMEKVRDRAGIQAAPPRRWHGRSLRENPFTPAERRRFANLYRRGVTLREIAAAFDVADASVHMTARQLGLPLRRPLKVEAVA